MQLARSYYGSSDELLRTDEISFELSLPTKEIVTFNFGEMYVIPKEARKTTLVVSDSYVTRTVSSIVVSGDFQSIENVSGNFLWATWTLGSGQVITADMSNLPIVGDLV
jgi:hypothetical protein